MGNSPSLIEAPRISDKKYKSLHPSKLKKFVKELRNDLELSIKEYCSEWKLPYVYSHWIKDLSTLHFDYSVRYESRFAKKFLGLRGEWCDFFRDFLLEPISKLPGIRTKGISFRDLFQMKELPPKLLEFRELVLQVGILVKLAWVFDLCMILSDQRRFPRLKVMQLALLEQAVFSTYYKEREAETFLIDILGGREYYVKIPVELLERLY